MSDVFISYSRKDSQFTQRLNTALVDDQRLVWVDWQGIPAGEDWWKEIRVGIENAETFVAVISENWLTSQICHQELEYARVNNKRILPVIHEKIDNDIEKRVKGDWMDKPHEQIARDNWSYIGHLNWIFVDSDDTFEEGFARLIHAIDDDQPHLKAHTRYQRRALEWKRSDENPSFLLVGDDLTFAEKWLEVADAENKSPTPTDIQRRYIEKSRHTTDEFVQRELARERRIQQFRVASFILGIIGIIAIIATAIAIPTSIEANNNNATSIAQIATADQALITATSVVEQVATGDANLATAIIQQEEALLEANNAQTQVAFVETTLTQVPPTLTAVATVLVDTRNKLNIEVDFSIARERLEDGLVNEAIQVASDSIEEFPDNIEAYKNRGYIYRQLEDWESAIIDYTTAISLDPDNSELYNIRAILHDNLGNDEAADRDYSNAIEIEPDHGTYYANRGLFYSTRGETDKALDDFNTAIELNPDNYNAYIFRAGIYRDRGDMESALSDYDSAAEMDSARSTTFSTRGNFHREQGNYDLAIADFNTAIAMEPQYAFHYNNRASVYREMGELENALADISKAIELDPTNRSNFLSRGLLFLDLEQYDNAIADFTFYIELDPTDAGGYDLRGTAYTKNNQPEKALADYNKVINELTTPGMLNVTSTVNRGWLYYTIEDYDNALDDFNRILRAVPDQVFALFNRGITYIQLGELDLAYQDYQEGIAIETTNSPYPDIDMIEIAILDLNDAIEKTPENGDLYMFRGYLYYVQGDTNSALAEWEQADELGTTFISEIEELRENTIDS